ncbi:MAG: histidinol-phosphate transaminase [Deltaproteobacteria bacterium]|nr:histidinol-phosphate transaminase [Deltaproteobacteria bacterium]
MDIRSLIKEEVLAQKAYAVEHTACPVKLDANENPLAMSGPLREQFAARLASVSLNRYPEAGSPALAARFAKAFGVGTDQVMLGNGSDELIQILCTAVARPGAEVMIPAPTFAMYRITAQNAGLKIASVPLDGEFDLDPAAMRERIAAHPPALTFLAWPNNPTGNCFRRDRIETILRESPGIVVVDEAYFHFSGQTFLPFLGRHENLVILRTLSKVGFAAMRVALLIGPPALVRELDKVRLPYNLNAMSQAAAGFYLDHEETFLKQAEEIRRWRGELFAALKSIPGIRPRPTDANFIFFDCDFDADRVYEQLMMQGILIRNFNAPGTMRNFMRVTVGTREENGRFIEVLRGIISK